MDAERKSICVTGDMTSTPASEISELATGLAKLAVAEAAPAADTGVHLAPLVMTDARSFYALGTKAKKPKQLGLACKPISKSVRGRGKGSGREGGRAARASSLPPRKRRREHAPPRGAYRRSWSPLMMRPSDRFSI